MTLSTPTRQVWVGEVTRWVTYPDVGESSDAPEHVVLVLNPDGSDDPGSIVLGAAAPPPPPTDPKAFYPPLMGTGQDLASQLRRAPLEGAPYALLGLWKTDTRLSFQINPEELWSAWCAEQTSCPPSEDCSGDAGSVALGVSVCAPYAKESSHPPSRDDLCGFNLDGISVCTCDQSGCRWNAMETETGDWTFDLELENSLLEGQLSSWKFSPSGAWILGVRLRRVQ